MRRAPVALLASFALGVVAWAVVACAEDAPRPGAAGRAPALETVVGLVRCRPPDGWTPTAYANARGADPVVAFTNGLDRIMVRAFGAPGSTYATPAGFLEGAAASTLGAPPERIGDVDVAGRSRPLYRHGYPIMLGDPHAASAPVTLAKEVFCVLPAGGDRFVVLGHAYESPAPDLEPDGERAWAAFLASVELPPAQEAATPAPR